MQDTVLVAEIDALEQLIHEGLDRRGLKRASFAVVVHVSLQVSIHVLEDKHKLILGVYHVVQSDNVLVLQFLHERDFTNGGRRRAFFRVEVDFLESNEFASLTVPPFEDLYRGWLCQLGVLYRVPLLQARKKTATLTVA